MGEKERDDIADRIIITIDAQEDIASLATLAKDLGPRARAFKLGHGILLHNKTREIVQSLRRRGADLSLDARFEEEFPDNMRSFVSTSFERGFRHVSVAPVSGALALRAAAESAPANRSVFAVLPSCNPELARLCLDNVLEANDALSDEKRIIEIMCNIGTLEEVKSAGDFEVIATGIRMPGDPQGYHPVVATPAEALSMGADCLVVGSAITDKTDRVAAFEQVLENAAQFR